MSMEIPQINVRSWYNLVLSIHNKDHRQKPATKKRFAIYQWNNSIVQYAVYDIILKYNKKLSVKDKIQENIHDEVDSDELNEIEQ